ncbi:putative quinol monooxygenase [Xanthomonas vesicatoria]|uniref:ABM domain-containing protein n=2 Tax=Xanthomonas vesicatoria TaxID=56460 RepID=F0BFL6_9XANT|nr:putative quinol monooxygenase [Xanthomonas vesicatoria]EGD08695.1 hypothetical protein XVE_3030 [Xanthomonas vesicatoria ATCC 35937]MCC8558231.1 antibiotic biosynthesis monooxygenase [Xanthomonas vesicatoria]MCC8596869.1 antibiotic biosynthesis monooxygenase [Xanthomonas vesicatoria]MCC8601825.1 antibiotic biosynthesis monooxygenase [Xanthomonas vesicatoria]MCC8605931.1 antibiotic biosynthesis monooxygenase [Xanthomonas vesicatoria]
MKDHGRREFILAAASAAVTYALPLHATQAPGKQMYGLIGKINVAPGQRDAVVTALLAGTRGMPGCLSYVVALDPTDADGIWVTEAWDSQESHHASLRLPAVQQAISQARPHIAGFGARFETIPVGGQGLTDTNAAAY